MTDIFASHLHKSSRAQAGHDDMPHWAPVQTWAFIGGASALMWIVLAMAASAVL